MFTPSFESPSPRAGRSTVRVTSPLLLAATLFAVAGGCAHERRAGPAGRDPVKIVITENGIVPPVARASAGARLVFESTRHGDVLVQFSTGECPLEEGCTFRVSGKGAVSRHVGPAGQPIPYLYAVAPEPPGTEATEPINGTLEITPRDD